MKFLRLLAAGFFLYSISAQHAYASDAAAAVIDEARADCSSFDGGVLETDAQKTISLVDLTGDGKSEEIVDANQFTCPTAPSLFCGTGGCSLTIVVGEKPFLFLAKGMESGKCNGR